MQASSTYDTQSVLGGHPNHVPNHHHVGIDSVIWKQKKCFCSSITLWKIKQEVKCNLLASM